MAKDAYVLTPEAVTAIERYVTMTLLEQDLVNTLHDAWGDKQPEEVSALAQAKEAIEIAVEYLDTSRSGVVERFQEFCRKHQIQPHNTAASFVVATLNAAREALNG